MAWKTPTQEEMLNFTVSQNTLDKITLEYFDVLNTYNGKSNNSYAYGHLAAFKFIFMELIGKPNFPVQDPSSMKLYNLEKHIWWLKRINFMIFEPLTKNPTLKDNENIPKKYQLGVWRQEPTTNLYSIAPEPSLIPKIMYNWLKDISLVNKIILEKIDNPIDLDQNLAKKIPAICYEQSFFFSSVQPFIFGNNQMGRWMENILRWQWKMPFKIRTPMSPDYKKWQDNLEKWEKQRLPKIIERAKQI